MSLCIQHCSFHHDCECGRDVMGVLASSSHLFVISCARKAQVFSTLSALTKSVRAERRAPTVSHHESSSSLSLTMKGRPGLGSWRPKIRLMRAWSLRPRSSRETSRKGSSATIQSLQKRRSMTEEDPLPFVHVGAPSSLTRLSEQSDRELKSSVARPEPLVMRSSHKGE